MKNRKILSIVTVLAAEALVLAVVLFGTALAGQKKRPDIAFGSADFRTAQEVDGEIYVFDSWRLDENYGGAARRIITPAFSIPDGIYRVTADYESGMPAEMLMEHGAHLELVPEEEIPNVPDPAFFGESAMLTSAAKQTSVLAYVSYGGGRAKVKVQADDGIPADLTLLGVHVHYLPLRTAAGQMVRWLPALWLITLLLCLRLLFKDALYAFLRSKGWVVLTLAGLVFLSCLPVLGGRVPDGSDLRFHYYRIYSIAEGMEAGVFPVRIQSGWMNGFGYANGIFYPDSMLYIPAVLYCLGMRMDRAYRCMVILIQTLTAVFSYLCFKRTAELCGKNNGNAAAATGRSIQMHRFAGLAGTALYLTAMPLLYNLYSMAGVGTAAASAFAPLVLAGMQEIYAENGEDAGRSRLPGKGAVLLALGMTGILANHLMSFLFAFLFLLLFALVNAGLTFEKKRIGRILSAACAAILCSAFVWIPFISERMQMSDMRGSERHWRLFDNAATPAELFATRYSVNTTEFSINATGLVNAPARSLGIIAAVILLMTAVLLLRMRASRQRRILAGIFALTLVIILLSSTIMPYDAIRAALPAVYGVIEKIQFPVRVHCIASLLIAYMAVKDIMLLPEVLYPAGQPAEGTGTEPDSAAAAKAFTVRTAVLVTAGILTLLSVIQGVDYESQYSNEVIPFRYASRMQDLKNYVSGGEYLPAAFDSNATLQPDEGLYDPAAVTATVTGRGYNRISMHIENRADALAEVVFPLTFYPGYRLRMTDEATGQVTDLPAEMEDNSERAMAVVPPGFTGTALMYYRGFGYWKAAELISLLSVLFMVYLLVKGRKADAGKASPKVPAGSEPPEDSRDSGGKE